MRVSKIGLIQKKYIKLDDQFPAQDLLLQTGQIEQFSSGVYAYGHIPNLIRENIENIITETLSKYECSKLSLPLLQPESIWNKSGRLAKYVENDVMFRCISEKGNFCLAPTAEEAIVEYAKPRLLSHKHLPTTYFQIGQKFRNEIRTRGYLLRGKAFDMMDAYSFGRDQKDLDSEYDRMKQAYLEIFEKLGFSVVPVGADSGAIGGSKSEEFMLLSDIGEDNILFDRESNNIFNSELLERPDCEEYLKNTYGIKNVNHLVSKKAVELGHIFQLGDKYSKSMEAGFIDEKGKKVNYVMGCYGIGVSRTLAMIYENNIIKDKNDNISGVCLPINISPYLLYIIPKTDDLEKNELAENIYKELSKKNIPVLYDDRVDMSIGTKIKDSKITGIPYFAVLGKTLDNGEIEIENNKTSVKTIVKFEEFIEVLSRLNNNKKDNILLEDIAKC